MPNVIIFKKRDWHDCRNLHQDFISFHIRESVCPHTTQQTIDTNRGFPIRGMMWFPHKPRNHRHDLLETNTGERHWTEYAILHNICRHWNIPQKLGCSDVFLQFVSALYTVSSRRELLSLGTEWNRTKFLSRYCSRYFFCCLIPSLIPTKEYGYRADQGWSCSMPVNLRQHDQKYSGMCTHVYWRHCLHGTQPPSCTGNNHLYKVIITITK